MRWVIVSGPQGNGLAIKTRRDSAIRPLFWWLVARTSSSGAELLTLYGDSEEPARTRGQ